MIIRNATIEDLDEIFTIYNRTINRGRKKKNIKKFIIQKKVRVVCNGRVLGVYLFEITRLRNPYKPKYSAKKYKWLVEIMVTPEMQGYGLGKKLMKDYLENSEDDYILVCEKNLIDFYRTFGFHIDDNIINRGRVQYIMFLAK